MELDGNKFICRLPHSKYVFRLFFMCVCVLKLLESYLWHMLSLLMQCSDTVLGGSTKLGRFEI